MAPNFLIIAFVLSSGALVCCDTARRQACAPIQYVEYGRKGVLNCDYQSFFSVIWYNSSDHINDEPLFYYTQSTKSGPGYRSGEFDVEENGSLVIKNVSLQHEHIFTVIKLDTSEDFSNPIYIEVVVIVKPSQQHPVIAECDAGSDFCFKEVYQNRDISCYVRDVRPAPNLMWLKENDSKDYKTSNELSPLPNQITYISRAIITIVQSKIPSLELVVCQSFSPIPILKKNRSHVLIQTAPLPLELRKSVNLLRRLNSNVKLTCTQGNISNIVWKLRRSNDEQTILAGAFGESRFFQVFSEGYEVDDQGSLIINNVNVKKEGIYGCIWGTGSTGGINFFNLTVYVPSVPKYPFVTECKDNASYCVIPVGQVGTLTCSLNRIRPLVHLEWITFPGRSKAVIHFHDENAHVTSYNDTFDVLVTSKFTITAMPYDRLTVQCRTRDPKWNNLSLFTEVDLIFIDESADNFRVSDWKFITSVSTTLLVAVVLVVFVVGRAIKRRRKQRESLEHGPEGVPMVNPSTKWSIKEKTVLFQQQLRGKYKDFYEAIQPIPYARNKYFSVEKLFVEPGMLWKQKNESWIPTSLSDIFSKSAQFNRILLEGDPGYGKTTCTLQMAYEWCSKTSYMKDIEILILIRLRQLSDITSIYTAIKYLLLPKDSPLGESDIKDILQNTGSAVIILDGFDEYPNERESRGSDINDIIERNMFQNFKVITTTRSFCLPPHFVAHTCRLKLNGFDDCAREKYISRTAVYNSKRFKEEIKRRLYDNPVIKDICQVPLFFVMFTHMVYDNETALDVRSITAFFKYVIACVYSHFERKTNDKSARPPKAIKTDHEKLDRLALNSLRENTARASWSEEEINEIIGQDLFDHYMQTGILIKEEIITKAENYSPNFTSPITYKTNVRFFHRLFHEWYASHHVARQIEKTDEEGAHNCLDKLNPFQFHYVYRFACGLNRIAAQKIIKYLNKSEDGIKLSHLCLLEQTDNYNELLKSIEIMCSKEIELGPTDSRLFHRSTLTLMEIASSSKIKIPCLKLSECIEYARSEHGAIVLFSDIRLPTLSTAQEIVIKEGRKSFTHKELECLLEYACRCVELKCLGFHWCMLPEVFYTKGHLSKFTARGSKVIWKPIKSSKMSFCVDMWSGKWKDETDGERMTKTEYKQILAMFQSTED